MSGTSAADTWDDRDPDTGRHHRNLPCWNSANARGAACYASTNSTPP